MVETLRRRSPFLGIVVPLALLAGQLSSVVHLMVVEHLRCPEHGELVHRTRAVAPAPALPGATGRADLAVIASTERPGEPHGHDHCASLSGRREITGPTYRPSADLAPPAHRAPPAEAHRSRGDRGVLLAFAPKTSPPPPA